MNCETAPNKKRPRRPTRSDCAPYALTPLLLLLLPPHPPHQNHHFPYFHCISSHHSRLRIPRAGTNGSKKDFGRLSPANGGRRLAKFIFTKLFIFTDQYILQH